MLSKTRPNWREWWQKAAEDELSIQAILKENGAPSTACFLAQQMAEKYLKGLLVFHQQPFRKIHDLLKLESLLLDKETAIKAIHNDLQRLNRYYIETRYPGDFPAFTLSEAQDAFVAAKRIEDHCLETVKKQSA